MIAAMIANQARRAWQHFEAVHAIVYFAPESRAAYTAAGLKGGWMGYFASRSAPMGAVGPEVVAAVFHNFSPTMVHRAIPDAWRFSSTERVLAARLEAVDGALRRLWGDDVGSPDVAEAAAIALRAAGHLRAGGRPLYAGHTGLAVPDEPHLALWHACTLLREHRFDGHVAALTAHGVDGLDALILIAAEGKGVDPATLRGFRGWTEEEWNGAQQKLAERGLIDADGRLTADGARLRAHVEEKTDEMAAAPWDALPDDERERLLAILRTFVAKLQAPGGLIYPNPIGVSPPDLA